MPDGAEDGRPLGEMDSKFLLAKLIGEVQRLNQKLDSMIEFSGKILRAQEELLQRTTKSYPDKIRKLDPDVMTLLTIPSALRKTAITLFKLKEATAEDLSKETGNKRAVESGKANELVRMGYLRKRREGRKTYFYIE